MLTIFVQHSNQMHNWSTAKEAMNDAIHLPIAAKASLYCCGSRRRLGPVSNLKLMSFSWRTNDCIRPPIPSFFSNMCTLNPCFARRPPRAKPPTPAPTTITFNPGLSHCSSSPENPNGDSSVSIEEGAAGIQTEGFPIRITEEAGAKDGETNNGFGTRTKSFPSKDANLKRGTSEHPKEQTLLETFKLPL